MKKRGRGGKFGPNGGRPFGKGKELRGYGDNRVLRDEEEDNDYEPAISDEQSIASSDYLNSLDDEAPPNTISTKSPPPPVHSHNSGDIASSSETKKDEKLSLHIIDGALEPSDKISRKLREIFKNGCDKEGYKWKLVPKTMKKDYWMEFQKKCVWDATITKLVKIGFRLKAKERYRDFMHYLRKLKQKPAYINNDTWKSWKEAWKKPEFQRVSAQNKKNRLATPSVHTGGSISHREHKRRLKKKLNREPRVDELFDYLHTKTHDGQSFVDERSREVHDRFNQIMESQTQPNEAGNVEQTEVDAEAAFLEAAGGVVKGRVYGTGSAVSLYYNTEFTSTSHKQLANYDELQSQHRLQMEEMQRQHRSEMEELNRQNEARFSSFEAQSQLRYNALEAQLQQTVEMLRTLVGSSVQSSIPPSSTATRTSPDASHSEEQNTTNQSED